MSQQDAWLAFAAKTKDQPDWRFGEKFVPQDILNSFRVDGKICYDKLRVAVEQTIDGVIKCELIDLDISGKSENAVQRINLQLSLAGWTVDPITDKLIAPDELPTRPAVDAAPAEIKLVVEHNERLWSSISIFIEAYAANIQENVIQKEQPSTQIFKKEMLCSAVFNPFDDLQLFIRDIEAGSDTKWAVDEEGSYATFYIWNAGNNMLQLRLTLERRVCSTLRPKDISCDFLLDKKMFLRQLRRVEDYFLTHGHWAAENPIDYFD